MPRVKWYLRQLLPLVYVSRFTDQAGIKRLCIWHMWLGRCFNTRWFVLCE